MVSCHTGEQLFTGCVSDKKAQVTRVKLAKDGDSYPGPSTILSVYFASLTLVTIHRCVVDGTRQADLLSVNWHHFCPIVAKSTPFVFCMVEHPLPSALKGREGSGSYGFISGHCAPLLVLLVLPLL